ncbi:MAG: LapA family protein [Gammaproteobacteria bacterium]|jgi:uncharacterized integral membrane protein|nr:LapA family protein [Gammaproteobacteria bacterium]
MRLFFIIILLLTVSVFGVIFTVFNAEQVPVNLYFVQYSLPMATVVFVAIFIGVLIGILLSFGALIRKHSEMVRLKKRFASLEQEVDNLRKIPIKDSH